MRKFASAIVICLVMSAVQLVAQNSTVRLPTKGNTAPKGSTGSTGSITPRGSATVAVTGWAMFANNQLVQNFVYTGSCPVHLKFEWGLTATAPTTVTYSAVRSDNVKSKQPLTVKMPKAGQSVPVDIDWNGYGKNIPQFANAHGWMNLVITSPNQVQKKITFTAHCK